jgi:hypothetical protein
MPAPIPPKNGMPYNSKCGTSSARAAPGEDNEGCPHSGSHAANDRSISPTRLAGANAHPQHIRFVDTGLTGATGDADSVRGCTRHSSRYLLAFRGLHLHTRSSFERRDRTPVGCKRGQPRDQQNEQSHSFQHASSSEPESLPDDPGCSWLLLAASVYGQHYAISAAQAMTLPAHRRPRCRDAPRSGA